MTRESGMRLQQLKWLYRALRYRYRLEPQEIRLLQRHLAAGDTAVDVGAPGYVNNFLFLKPSGTASASGTGA